MSGHKVVYLYGESNRVVDASSLPPLKAIKAHCVDCSGGVPSEARDCLQSDCPLWAYRLGRNPFRRKRVLTDEQRAAGAERLAAARARRE